MSKAMDSSAANDGRGDRLAAVPTTTLARTRLVVEDGLAAAVVLVLELDVDADEAAAH